MNRLGSTRQSCSPGPVWYGVLWLLISFVSAAGEVLDLPPRDHEAPDGLKVAHSLIGLDLKARDEKILTEVLAGNVPDFLRQLVPVSVTNISGSRTNTAVFYVTADYLAIGSDTNYFLSPVAPETAQKIADALHCSLPTSAMVDAIYKMAAVKLEPMPIPPGPEMTTVPIFIAHNEVIKTQRVQSSALNPLGALVAGHKKDVVISPKLDSSPGKVAIYGWHKTNGVPIQPLYLGHTATWVDYSQCARIVLQKMLVNGKMTTVAETLQNKDLAVLLSNEGIISNPRYSTNSTHRGVVSLKNFVATGSFGERTATFDLEPEVRVHINAPLLEVLSGRKVLLIFFSLPNGNTIGQTVGKSIKNGDDWHYNIQHIGAQTRFLRRVLPSRAIVVAYLEATQKSWPAWRKKHGDEEIPRILENVKNIFYGFPLEVALTSHSGGGSFVFGYLNGVKAIPDDIVRIAFLDSNYAYDARLGHNTKFANWITNSPAHFLTVLAYNDAVALLDGKSFVSAAGGTWGKSHEMQTALTSYFPFETRETDDFEHYFALSRRVQFLLRKNPDRKVLHTVQVELNGFIHSMLAGTSLENKGYDYFGPRAYTEWIATK
jgi:hypothetical protein